MNTEERRVYMRAYRKTDKWKASQQSPARKAYMKAYKNRHKMIAHENYLKRKERLAKEKNLLIGQRAGLLSTAESVMQMLQDFNDPLLDQCIGALHDALKYGA